MSSGRSIAVFQRDWITKIGYTGTRSNNGRKKCYNTAFNDLAANVTCDFDHKNSFQEFLKSEDFTCFIFEKAVRYNLEARGFMVAKEPVTLRLNKNPKLSALSTGRLYIVGMPAIFQPIVGLIKSFRSCFGVRDIANFPFAMLLSKLRDDIAVSKFFDKNAKGQFIVDPNLSLAEHYKQKQGSIP